MYKYDVIIIGGGVCGCAVARELSRYKVNVCVLEKEEDVCCGPIRFAGEAARTGLLGGRLQAVRPIGWMRTAVYSRGPYGPSKGGERRAHGLFAGGRYAQL